MCGRLTAYAHARTDENLEGLCLESLPGMGETPRLQEACDTMGGYARTASSCPHGL